MLVTLMLIRLLAMIYYNGVVSMVTRRSMV